MKFIEDEILRLTQEAVVYQNMIDKINLKIKYLSDIYKTVKSINIK